MKIVMLADLLKRSYGTPKGPGQHFENTGVECFHSCWGKEHPLKVHRVCVRGKEKGMEGHIPRDQAFNAGYLKRRNLEEEVVEIINDLYIYIVLLSFLSIWASHTDYTLLHELVFVQNASIIKKIKTKIIC